MRELPAPFLEMIQGDIERISDSLSSNNHQIQWQLFRELDGRYQACVKDWYKGMWHSSLDGSVLHFNNLKNSLQSIIDNLRLVKSKLETFQYQMNAVSLPELPIPATQVNVTTNVGIHITFEQVRSQIEEMTSLTAEQTHEVLEKINEIEDAVQSTDN